MDPEFNESEKTAARRPGPAAFYKARQRVSMGLLIFVVVVGLPIVGVPHLRQRLSTRVLALKSAMSGEIKPATLEVGANKQPFPAEYERPALPVPRAPELPETARLFTMNPSGTMAPVAPAPRPRTVLRAKIETPPPSQPSQPSMSESAESKEPAAAPADTSGELKYQTGKAEQEAYALLLKSNATIAGMVQGSNPALKFKSWDAASRGEDTYWVRLKFQSNGSPDVEYIWQVKVQANEVTPLSYNARSIS